MNQQARETSIDIVTYDASRTGPRVLLLSDVHIVRHGLALVLRAARAQWRIAMSASLSEVSDALAAGRSETTETPETRAVFDVVLLDMSMTDALASARTLSGERLCRVVAFAAVDSDDA